MTLTPEEEAQAKKEGWALFNGGTQFRAIIGGPFRTRIDAYEWLVQQANSSSIFHTTVLQSLPTCQEDIMYYHNFQVVKDKITANKVKQKLIWLQ